VVTTLNSYASAKKLSESTMPPVFVDLHRILRNKVASLALLTDMLALCETEAAKAELANEPQRIRNIIKWLRAIAFPNLSDFTEDEESKEEGA
jgi:ABC-type transporter Mla MlaB component